jgi:hypothetical protein
MGSGLLPVSSHAWHADEGVIVTLAPHPRYMHVHPEGYVGSIY